MKKNLFVAFALLFIAAFPLISNARIVPQCDGPCGLCDFFILFANFFNFIAFKLAPPVAAFLFLLAGILFLASGGSEKMVSRAKGIFANVVIGLVIIYTSWLLVGALIKTIGKNVGVEGATWNPQTWNKFDCK